MLTKDVIGGRIKALRIEKGLSQQEFGDSINLTRSAISQIEGGQIFPSLESIDKIVKHYSGSWESIVGDSVTMGNVGNSNVPTIRTILIPTDHAEREKVLLVPVKAQAGYLIGAQQPEYIERLSMFSMPGLHNGIFRAFEVTGYSMLADRIGFFPGDIVIGEYVESVKEIKDGLIYVLVNDAPETDNIIVKRCLNYIDKGGVIICKSDNKDPQYPTFPLPIEKIKEVWKFRMKISRQAPEPSGLYERMNALEGDLVMLKDQLTSLKVN
jgi:transcriptional regulator with XRE-family HTH domain